MTSNFLAKITGFAISMKDWALAGCPQRSPEWIAEIFEEHCKPCEFYNPSRNVFRQKGYCEKCGCHVSADPNNPLNKIVSPLNSCPLDPPKWGGTIECKQKSHSNEKENNEHS